MNHRVAPIVLLALLQSVLGILNVRDLLEHPNEACLKEGNWSLEEFVQLRKKSEREAVLDMLKDQRSCYILCVGKEHGMFDEKGIPNHGLIASSVFMLPAYKVSPVSRKCAKIGDVDPCKAVKRYLECMIAHLL